MGAGAPRRWVDDQGEKQQRRVEDLPGVGRHVGQREAVIDDGDHQQSQQGPGDRAAAAGQASAAEQHGGHHGELDADRGGGQTCAEL